MTFSYGDPQRKIGNRRASRASASSVSAPHEPSTSVSSNKLAIARSNMVDTPVPELPPVDIVHLLLHRDLL